MTKPAHDPRRIFRIAEWFNLGSNTLRGHISEMRGVAVPSVVLGAFSLELYLKCLIAIETGKPPPTGHNLRWLFDRLSSSTQRKIIQYFDNPTDQHEINWRKTLKNPPKHVPQQMKISSFTFDEVLDTSARAFGQFRYIFESGTYKTNASWNAGYIVVCARRVIVEMHPDWDKPEANY